MEKHAGPVNLDVAGQLDYYKKELDRLISCGDFQSADEISRKIIQLAEKAYPEKDARTLEPMMARLEVAKKLGYEDESRKLLSRILIIKEKLYANGDPDIETARLDFAQLCMKEPKDLAMAETQALKAFKAREGAGKMNDPSVVQMLLLLSEINIEKGELNKAEDFLNKAYNLAGVLKAKDMSPIFSNFARLYSLKKDKKKAEEYARMAMKSGSHAAESNLSDILQGQGKGEEAISGQLKLLAREEKRVGKESPELFPVLSRLGELYRRNMLLNDARGVYLRQLTILEKNNTADIKARLSVVIKLAIINRELENVKEAEKYFNEALELCGTRYGEKSREYSDVMNSTMEFYRQFPDSYDKAEELGLATLSIDSDSGNGSGYRISRDLNDLGKLYVYEKKWGEAENFCSKSLKLLAEKSPAESPSDWLLYNFEAHLYLFETMDARNRFSEAAGHLQSVHDILYDRVTKNPEDLYTEAIVFGMTLEAVEVLPGSFPVWGKAAEKQFGKDVDVFRDRFYAGNFTEALSTLEEMIRKYKQVHQLNDEPVKK
ncbi:MAG: hypothetical protein M1269_00835 [Chloroflexi bacterium]|nr:hypothetical protein [Chloroflexota bacterium]